MSVHYKFKAAKDKDFSTVTFDGINISVADLKKEIIEQKRLAKNADFDLQIQNAETKEVYQDENALIPKNTSVNVARVPIADKKKSFGPPGSGGGPGRGDGGRFANAQRNHLANLPPAAVAKGVDLASMDLSEEEKIKAMMSQSTADYDPSRYMKIRGSNQHGRVPDNYRCYKCNQTGHWIKNCPMPHETTDIKKSTGIPRSFMVMVEGPDVPGALITPEGQYAVPAIDREAYMGKNKPQAEPVPKPKIPEELICPLCQDLLTDALLVPCCANSYCDDCIRNTLLESDDQECPGCHEKETSPNDLIPNRFLRTAVNAFKNETGYSKPAKIHDKKFDIDSPHKEAQAAAAESRKISIEEGLPEDLFPHSPRKVEAESAEPEAPDSTKDLYDFNDGSIPSPFAVQESGNSNSNLTGNDSGPRDSNREHDNRPMSSSSQGPPPGSYQGPPPPFQHSRDFSRPPPQYNRNGPPPPHQYGPPPNHSGMSMSGPHHSDREPPPPGFGDVLPPGEERMQMSRHGPNSGLPPPHHHMMGPSRDDRDRHGPPPGHLSGPGGLPGQHQQQGPPGSGPFNPMQPPPGYPPPGNMHRPPMGGPPPGPGQSGQFPPNQYPPNFNRMPPGGNDPMYQQSSYPMDNRHRDRDDYRDGRGRPPPPPRRSFHRDRIGGMPPGDENRPGAIEDPLKEFERIMREKDRRKQQMSGGLKKRSKSRSMSPPLRRSQSPPPPVRKRTRSPSFPRSPSPKRKRIPPLLKRRNSYSRSRSRTPPQPVRRAPRSRSPRDRDRDRNRTDSPLFAKQRERERERHSPRRAPPFSPSPPSSRYPKKEKDEYFRDEHHSRYEDRHSRYPPSSKHHSSSRDYKSGSTKYDDDYKYGQDKYDSSAAPRQDSHHHTSSSSAGRYDYKSSSSRNYHSSSHRGQTSGGPLPPLSPGGAGAPRDRERDKPYFDNPSLSNNRRPYDYDPSLAPPGTERLDQPSGVIMPLLELNIAPLFKNQEYNDSRHSHSNQNEKSDIVKPPSDLHINKKDEIPPEKSAGGAVELKKDSKEHRRRKSSEDKKIKKEHKKKHKKEKKKDKEEKKDKKRKKSKDGDDTIETATALLIPETEIKIDPSVLVSDSKIIVETKLTALCDSTVKSPERNSGLAIDSKALEIAPALTLPLVLGEQEDNPYISDRGVLMPDLTKQTLPVVKEDINITSVDKVILRESVEEKEKVFVVPMPASKWDEFDESVDLNLAKEREPTPPGISVRLSPTVQPVKPSSSGESKSLSTDKSRSDKSLNLDKPRKSDNYHSLDKSRSDRSRNLDKPRSLDISKRSSDRGRDRNVDRTGGRDRSRDRDIDRPPLIDRSRDGDKDRSRERVRDRSRERIRDRSREGARDRLREGARERSREGARDRLREGARERSREGARNRSREGIRERLGEFVSEAAFTNEYPVNKPPLKSRISSRSSDKTRSSDKARDGASGVAAAFTNDYADLNKKAKQRINIKLSSTAKAEKDSNNSSSSEEHEGGEEGTVVPGSEIPAAGATDPLTGLPLDPNISANKDKNKKKAKRHRSESSSSSSSSSSDGKHKKKSKKSKKKKKKKKKSK